MKIFHGFSGLDSWGIPFREHGHQVITLDWEPAFGADLVMDIREFAKDPQRYLDEVAVKKGWIRPGEHWLVDAACYGPDCRGLSVAALGHNWRLSKDAGYIMKTDTAALSVELVKTSLDVNAILNPRWWILENPRAILRRIARRFPLGRFERVTVTYCQYGMPYQKPTDLWGVFPPSWRPRPVCKPKAPCHESAPRGSRLLRESRSVESHGDFLVDNGQRPQDLGYGIINDGKGGTKVLRHPQNINNRHPMRVSPPDGASWNETMRSKDNTNTILQRHAESITTHLRADGSRGKGTRDKKDDHGERRRVASGPDAVRGPLAMAGRAAALRAVVPRKLVEEWRDACERDFEAPRAKPRNILGWI